MGLILRSSSLANSGNTVSVKGSALSYVEGDGNFVYLLTNMSGSNISITGSTSIKNNLTVLGGITGSLTGSLTGLLFGTSSFATVAQTASSADNFNIRNTLTATTIVVQTITSSISYLTGSTRFGSLLDNTHTFTGSILLTGSIGIGTASPATPLDVRSAFNTTGYTTSETLTGATNLSLYQIRNENVSTDANGESGILISQTFNNSAQWGISVKRTNSFIGDLIFRTRNASTTSAELMRITSDGDVGIGTASPAARLDVATSSSTGTTSMLSLKRAAGYGLTLFEQSYDSTFFANGKTLTLKNDTGNAFVYFAGNNAGTITNLIIPSGSVGIGTTTPNARLDVSGSVLITGSLDITGSTSMAGNLTVYKEIRVIESNNALLRVQSSTNTLPLADIELMRGTNTTWGADIHGDYRFRNSSGSLSIQYGDTGVITSPLTISSSGNINIGNTSNNTHTITGSLSTSGSVVVTGSFTVFSGSLIDFQVTDTGTIKGNLVTDTHIVTGSIRISGSSHTTIGNLALTGSQVLSGSLVIDSGSIRVASGSISTPKVLGNTATPVMASGTGAGSAPTISISGSDVAGYIRVLTGTGPATKNDIVTVTFSSAYASLPYVLVTPASYSASLALGGVSGAFTTSSAAGFTIFSGDGALRGATAYTWSYHVFG